MLKIEYSYAMKRDDLTRVQIGASSVLIPRVFWPAFRDALALGDEAPAMGSGPFSGKVSIAPANRRTLIEVLRKDSKEGLTMPAFFKFRYVRNPEHTRVRVFAASNSKATPAKCGTLMFRNAEFDAFRLAMTRGIGTTHGAEFIAEPALTEESDNERFERLAAEFYKDSGGMMAPGKDDRRNTHSYNERVLAWQTWSRARGLSPY